MKKLLLLFPVFLGCIYTGKTQIVGSDVFLKGQYVEIGIEGGGGFEGAPWNSASPPVAGMHHRSSLPYFGFVANAQMDGWVNFDGDFFTPGTPENGWGLEIIDAGGTVDIKTANNRYTTFGEAHVPGSITGYTNISGVQTATWEGDFDSLAYDLHITIVYTLYDTALAYTTDISIQNNGDDIDELYYYRNIDPDNNVSLLGDYSTRNTIISQPSDTSTLAAVKAEQLSPWYSCYTLSTNDSTCRVTYGNFSNRDATDIWNGTPGFSFTVGQTEISDEAVSLVAKMDTLISLRAARSISFVSTFGGRAPEPPTPQRPIYATGTDVTDLNAISTGIQETGMEEISIYPNPTMGTLNITSGEPIEQVSVFNSIGVLQLQTEGSSRVDLSALSPGTYLVKVQTAKGKVIQRIQKQ